MNHPIKSTSDCGFRLTAEAVALLNDKHERRYRFTPEGKAEMEKQSHRQLVDEAIEEMEQEEAQKADKPLSKGDKLSILIACGERLGTRHRRFLELCEKASDFESKKHWLEKGRIVQLASFRIARKISKLVCGD